MLPMFSTRLNLSVQWLGAVSACCGASLRSSARLSPHFSVLDNMCGHMNLLGATLTDCVFALEHGPVDGSVLHVAFQACVGYVCQDQDLALLPLVFPSFDVLSDLYGCTVLVGTPSFWRLATLPRKPVG